jgi:L-alanine-DL-glutamate epimerase-like enolase superfamily enzyme
MTAGNHKNIQLSIQELVIPFKVSFKHASAERSATESVLVEAKTNDNEAGYGESCPRSYVTGETLSSVREFFIQHQQEIEDTIVDLNSMKKWMRNHLEEIDKNPAAWCAIELALLDVFAKVRQSSIEQLLDLAPVNGAFIYAAVLGDSGDEIFNRQFQQYRNMEFTDFKIKLSGKLTRDLAKMDVIKNDDCDKLRVRFDANNLWQDVDEVGQYLAALNYPFFAIEEPLASKDIAELAKLAEQANTKIILDESLSRLSQFKLLEGTDHSRWIINVRISKMGGIIRSLEIVNLARQLKVPVIVGAQVGETSLLTRAALTVASAARDVLIGQEGAFGTMLLENDICSPSLMFGKEGKLEIDEAKFDQLPGFGLQIDSRF